MPHGFQRALTNDERVGVVLAVRSVFAALRNLYDEVEPIFERHGFTAPSTPLIARELAAKIAAALPVQCASFTTSVAGQALQRDGRTWQVHVTKDGDLNVNHAKAPAGENYVVVDYRANAELTRIWILWDAQDHLFSPKRARSSARALIASIARPRVEVLYEAAPAPARPTTVRAMAKAALSGTRRRTRFAP